MTDLAGLVAYTIAVYGALTYHDYLRHQSRCASYRARAERLHTLKGKTP